MAAPRNRRHILIRTPPRRDDYRPHPRKIELAAPPATPNRRRHASALKASLREAQREAQTRRGAAEIVFHGAEPGIYIEFASRPGLELKLESLEDKRKGIELVAVTRQAADDGAVTELATVFVPDG